jgi:DNA topoisomerase IB
MSEERNRPRGGWLRAGSKGRFRYLDRNRRRIGDEERITRIESLAIPPAWTDVWISPRPYAKLQATGYDKAGRKQYLYHPDYRAAQEEAKYDGLIRFGGRLPELRAAMTEHLDKDELDRERVSAIALRVISLGWFRVGSERYAREGTYGVTTLLRRQVHVRGRRIRLSFRRKPEFECAPSSSTRTWRTRSAASCRSGVARGSSSTAGRTTSTTSRANG